MAASRARIHLGPLIVDARVDGDIVRTADGKDLPVTDVIFAPPCQLSKVICVGFNYRDHAAELSWEPPSEPLLFLKPPSAVIGHEEPIPYPRHTSRLEYEGELAVVIGRRARDISRERALDYVDGYTIFKMSPRATSSRWRSSGSGPRRSTARRRWGRGSQADSIPAR